VLTADELCDICGTTPAQRQAWAKEGDLRQQRGFEELDAAELAAYARLREAAGPKRGKAAWRDLRGPLQKLLLNPPRRLWIVINAKGVERHAIATRPEELARQVDDGRPVVAVNLRRVIDEARAAYRQAAVRSRRNETAQVRALRAGS